MIWKADWTAPTTGLPVVLRRLKPSVLMIWKADWTTPTTSFLPTTKAVGSDDLEG